MVLIINDRKLLFTLSRNVVISLSIADDVPGVAVAGMGRTDTPPHVVPWIWMQLGMDKIDRVLFSPTRHGGEDLRCRAGLCRGQLDG